LDQLLDAAEDLEWENSKLNWSETVVALTPEEIKPKTAACTKLFEARAFRRT